MTWTRLVRFESGGEIFLGEPDISKAGELHVKLEGGGLYADVYEGDSFHSLSQQPTQRKKVDQILAFLEPKDVPIIKCVGLNYVKHSKAPFPNEQEHS